MVPLVRGLAGVVCSLLMAIGLPTAAAEPSEYAVKAAFLYNFSKFVEWPEAAAEPAESALKICVLGENPFGALLSEVVKDKQVSGRRIDVHYTRSVARAAECEVVFIGASEQARVDDLLRRLGKLPVLTVSDLESFAERGGVIGLKLDRNKVRFEVNMVAARQAGLKLSSQLLKVATAIHGQLGENP